MDAAPVRLLCCDLDGTLVGQPGASRRFHLAWQQIPQESRPVLVYNSCRLVDDVVRFTRNGLLPDPTYFIGGAGTQIMDSGAGRVLGEFRNHFADGWDLARVRAVVARLPDVRPQPFEFQHEFKSSWILDDAAPGTLRDLTRNLAAHGLKVKIAYSAGRDLDILPRAATKGGAMSWLCQRLDIPLSTVVVAGDTDSDLSMFRTPGVRGIVVGNAVSELVEGTAGVDVFQSDKDFADGVLDGLVHYGIIGPQVDSPDIEDLSKPAEDDIRQSSAG
ncbi:MAG TPA: HAD family hydrolase [Candidatus Didemnitutus sp.]